MIRPDLRADAYRRAPDPIDACGAGIFEVAEAPDLAPLAIGAAFRLEACVLFHAAQRRVGPRDRKALVEAGMWTIGLARWHESRVGP